MKSLWVLDCRLDKRSNLKISLLTLGNRYENSSQSFNISQTSRLIVKMVRGLINNESNR